MKAVVAAFNQEKALVGAFSVITNLQLDLFEALVVRPRSSGGGGSAADQNNVKVKQTAALSLGSLATVPESGAVSRQEAGKSRVHGAEAKTI